MKKEKIALCIFGVVPRSIRYVYGNMKSKLIEPLRENFDLDIYVFNNNIGMNMIDNIKVNQDDCSIIGYDLFEEEKQDEIDIKLRKRFGGYGKVFAGYHLEDMAVYGRFLALNSFRCMYSEDKVGLFLEKNMDIYKAAVVTSSDFWFFKDINIGEVVSCLDTKNAIYTSDIADAGGYTDGFMIGNIKPLVKVLKRYTYLEEYLPFPGHYEGLLKESFDRNGIRREISDMGFFKVRANRGIFRSPHEGILKKYSKKYVDEKYKELENHINKVKKMKKEKIALCIFGVVPRSIRYVYGNMKSRLIEPLRENFDLDIYVFNLNIEESRIDKTNVDQEDCKILKCDFFEEVKQREVDIEIDEFFRTHDYSMRHPKNTRNCLRCMYSENRVALFLMKNKHKYRGAVACSTDLWYIKRIDIREVRNSLGQNRHIYTCCQNDAGGYTDGFYFGKTDLMIKIMRRYPHRKSCFPTETDYEGILKKFFVINNIERKISNIGFFKVRANKIVWWSTQPHFLKLMGDEKVRDEYKRVRVFLDNFPGDK